MSLPDDQEVYAETTTDTGVAELGNVPRTAIFVPATASENRRGTAGGIGYVGTLTMTLTGLNSPTTVNNNDFSRGRTDGTSRPHRQSKSSRSRRPSRRSRRRPPLAACPVR